MTKEELLLDRFRILNDIYNGRGTFFAIANDDTAVRYVCATFEIIVDTSRPGWGFKAEAALTRTVLEDTERALKEYETEAAETQGRLLRKVNIRG
jgi:hypothetical protein